MSLKQSAADYRSVSMWRSLLVVAPLLWAFGAGCGSSTSGSATTKPSDAQPGQTAPGPSDNSAGGNSDDTGAGTTGGSSPNGVGGGPDAGDGDAGGTLPGAGDDDAGGESSSLAGSGSGPVNPVPGHGSATLGSSCKASSDCKTGLTCITADSDLLGNHRAPPHGLCTASCTAPDDCAQFGAAAICYPFSDGGSGFCIEGCAFGEPAAGAKKCHDRLDFSCLPALIGQTTDPCQDYTDCFSGELCLDGACAVPFPGCLPSCRGDLDCPSGAYCDQSFLGGTCTTSKPSGKGLGEPCTVPSSGEAPEPDECIGYCQSDSGGSAGHCATTCGLGNGCAWDAQQQQFDGACLSASTLTADVGAAGDFGFCTLLCSCKADCLNASLDCAELPDGPLGTGFSGPGLCLEDTSGLSPIDQCSP